MKRLLTMLVAIVGLLIALSAAFSQTPTVSVRTHSAMTVQPAAYVVVRSGSRSRRYHRRHHYRTRRHVVRTRAKIVVHL